MLLSRFRLSLAAIAGLALAWPAPARALPYCSDNLKDDARAAITSSLVALRRALHIESQDDVVSHAIAISSREATLELELANGRTRTIALRGGRVLLDGQPAGTYVPGGVLDRSWRRALADGAQLETRALMVALRAWREPELRGDEAQAKSRLDETLRSLGVRTTNASAPATGLAKREDVRIVQPAGQGSVRLNDLAALDTISRQLQALDEAGTDVAEAVRTTPVQLGDVAVAAGQRVSGNVVVYKGSADIFGEVTGNVVSLYGDVTYHRGAIIGRNAVSIGGRVVDQGGVVRGDIKTISPAQLAVVDRVDVIEVDEDGSKAATASTPPSALDLVFHDVRNVLAVFVALAMVGFGTVFFGRRYVEVVADTARHAFGRSFVVGLLGQLLLLPTFAMLIVGLIFTLVGILLLPFAAVAYVLAAIAACVGGYLAVAHAIGETVARRRMANGAFVRAPNAYGYLFTGLVGLLGLWAAAALTGWMGPVVLVFKVAAVIVTWIAMTTGFGAALLSRAGLRETFAGRHYGEMSDEYLWATPPATPTAARTSRK